MTENASQDEISALQEERDALVVERDQLRIQVNTLNQEKDELGARISTVEQDKAELRMQLEANKANIAQLINEKQELATRVDELEKAIFEVKVEDVATVFKTTLKSLQREVGEPEEPGELGYMVDKFEVELKSGLALKDGIKLVQPTAAELKPEGLSTIRMSFKAKPRLKITEE